MGTSSGKIPTPPNELTYDPLTSPSGTLVAERFNSAKNYADSAWGLAITYLNDIAGQVYTIPTIDITVADVISGIDGLVAVVPDPITITATDIEFPAFTKDAPEMGEVVTDIGTAPNFVAIRPVLEIPSLPDVTWPVFTKDAPPMNEIAIPTAPAYELPPVPQIDDVAVPSPPDFNIPSFTADLPVLTAVAPTPAFVWNEVMYSSDMLTALEDKIKTGVIDGGTGLDTDVEEAIYNRARSRQITDNERMYDETLNYFASRGHSVPPGALNGALVEIRNKILQVLEDLENGILVSQGELAQKNTHFVISAGIAYEKNLMDYTNEFQERTFQATKYVTDHAILLYKIQVTAYEAELEGYKIFAQVFVARIQAETAKAEFYKAQIQGLSLTVEVKRLLIDAYTAQVNGIKGLIDLYVAEMQGANIQSSIEQNRIQGYAVEVQAFAAKNNALVARFNAYQAQIAGETEKSKMFMAEAQAYESEVRGYKAKADVEVSRVQIEVEKNKGEVATFAAEIDKYKAEIVGATEQARITATEQGFKVDKYKAETSQYAAEIDGIVRVYLGKVEELKAEIDTRIKEADINVQRLLGEYELTVKQLDSAARVSAQLAASSMNSVSASANLGFSESRSDSRGFQSGWQASSGVTAHFAHDVTKRDVETKRSEQHVYSPGERTF